MDKIFFMVFVAGGNAPAFVHSTIESAENEAKRLAKTLNKKTFVLMSYKSYELNEFKEEVFLKSTEINDLPF